MSFMSVERIIDRPWDVFEKTVLRLLIHSGWKQIIHTGRTGDMGADIIGIDTSGKSCTSMQIQTFCYLDWSIGSK